MAGGGTVAILGAGMAGAAAARRLAEAGLDVRVAQIEARWLLPLPGGPVRTSTVSG
ncbi:NAD(P)-binding protein, partial [Methylobacterium sp. WL103]